MKSHSYILILACCGMQIWAEPALTVMVKHGEGTKFRAGEPSPNRIEVLVTDAAGKPVSNATVTYSLPREGVTGIFPSGLSSESVLTSGDGTAAVSGIAWVDRAGVALIEVKASRKGEIGAAMVTIEVTPGTGDSRTISSRSGKGKWILVAAAAGAALAGVAFAGGKGATAGSTGAVLIATPPPPTVGTPAISIGKP
ncbi:MAG TPA: hypothetical protein PKJ41_01710 [Bryobacteraceae bacterium]|nr:hypothetical protein [Bryobacteraceae bacterium]